MNPGFADAVQQLHDKQNALNAEISLVIDAGNNSTAGATEVQPMLDAMENAIQNGKLFVLQHGGHP